MNSLKQQRKYLPGWYAKQISQKLKCSIRRVYNVVNGTTQDVDIAFEIVRIAESRRKKAMQLDKKIKAAI